MPDEAKIVKVFLGDSVPTAHLPSMKVLEMSDESDRSSIPQIIKKSSPTGHLPRVPQDDGAGASVPTGHLPSDAAPAQKPPENNK